MRPCMEATFLIFFFFKQLHIMWQKQGHKSRDTSELLGLVENSGDWLSISYKKILHLVKMR